MGSDESHFNVSLIVRDKVTRQSAHWNHNFWRERRAEADSNRGPSVYQPNALPLGQTGSHQVINPRKNINTLCSREENKSFQSKKNETNKNNNKIIGKAFAREHWLMYWFCNERFVSKNRLARAFRLGFGVYTVQLIGRKTQIYLLTCLLACLLTYLLVDQAAIPFTFSC